MTRAWLAGLAATIGLMAPGSAAAVGGPTPDQPAVAEVTRAEARVASQALVRRDIMLSLPKPRTMRVYGCRGGPKVWRCQVRITSPDSRCRMETVVWSPGADGWYVEYQRLRCAAR